MDHCFVMVLYYRFFSENQEIFQKKSIKKKNTALRPCFESYFFFFCCTFSPKNCSIFSIVDLEPLPSLITSYQVEFGRPSILQASVKFIILPSSHLFLRRYWSMSSCNFFVSTGWPFGINVIWLVAFKSKSLLIWWSYKP